ncbi:MAG: Hint domain-containing protein, partial [Cyanobacteria bacterium P01_F01_bin.3]
QTFDRTSKQPHPFRTYPICIKAGALGNNLPMRDLYVSPDHALFIDGLLINAGALTNGTSIVQIEMEQFVYHHIELEHHALLLAEGTPAESYLPQNQARDLFDNGKEYEELYPNHNSLSLLPMNVPRVNSKRQLPRFVSKRLSHLAKQLYQETHQEIA